MFILLPAPDMDSTPKGVTTHCFTTIASGSVDQVGGNAIPNIYVAIPPLRKQWLPCVRKSNVLRHTHSFHQCYEAVYPRLGRWPWHSHRTCNPPTTSRRSTQPGRSPSRSRGGRGKEVGRFYKNISGWISWFLSYMQYESNWYTADVLFALYIIRYFLWFCTLYIFIKTYILDSTIYLWTICMQIHRFHADQVRCHELAGICPGSVSMLYAF